MDWDLERVFWGVRKMSSLRLEHFVRAFSMEASCVRGSLVGVGDLVGVWELRRLEFGCWKAWWRAWARAVESVSEMWGLGLGGVVSSRVSSDMLLSL